MIRGGAIVFMIFYSWALHGQVHLPKLVLKPKQTYELKGDILVVDSLIMHDSSHFVLNKLKPDNFIHARVAVFYRGSEINGRGAHGISGNAGRAGASPVSPCLDGGTGLPGNDGTAGGKGINVFIYFSEFILKGPLTIDVSGGDAGDGGTGGPGGNGGPGTRPCYGGNGGQGGDGGHGGNGGNSGSISFVGKRAPQLRSDLSVNLIVRNYGGSLGLGGKGGPVGLAGLSPVGNTKMDGKTGKKGLKGKDGTQGAAGSVNFQEK